MKPMFRYTMMVCAAVLCLAVLSAGCRRTPVGGESLPSQEEAGGSAATTTTTTTAPQGVLGNGGDGAQDNEMTINFGDLLDGEDTSSAPSSSAGTSNTKQNTATSSNGSSDGGTTTVGAANGTDSPTSATAGEGMSSAETTTTTVSNFDAAEDRDGSFGKLQ